jgi:1-acyl-sn-glycerol-3-phosphate acyltransferase
MGSRVPGGLGRLQAPAKTCSSWFFAWWFGLRVTGAENVPREGPVIVSANHVSMLDVPLLVVACPRRMTFMAKRDLFKDPFRAWFFHGFGGFPVEPGTTDAAALRTGLAVLASGDLLGMFSEGTRSQGRPMGPFLPGAAWLALRSGVPIVPCAIAGTAPPAGSGWLRWFRPRRVRISFGPPMRGGEDGADRREAVASLTESVRSAVVQLQHRG